MKPHHKRKDRRRAGSSRRKKGPTGQAKNKPLASSIFSGRQHIHLEAIRAGLSHKEAMALLNLKYGVVSNWKRWNPEFRCALNDAAKEGLGKRAKLRFLDCMIQRYGKNFIPGTEFQALLDARASARASADGRACIKSRPEAIIPRHAKGV